MTPPRPWELDALDAYHSEAIGSSRAALAVEGAGGNHYGSCPVCADTNLRIRESSSGEANLTCRRGCEPEAIRAKLRGYRRSKAAKRSSPPPDSTDAAAGKPEGGLRTRGVDLTRVRPVRWAWARRLPLGYLSLLLGAEGIGKGTVLPWIVARLTRGELPGDLEGEAARVLIVGDEDSFDSVIVPRLYAAGADLGLVSTLDESAEDFDVHRDAAALRDLIAREGYRLLVLDALLDNLGVNVDDWRSKPVRDALRPLRRVARELDVCVIGALHPNKGSRTSFRDLVSGTHAFNASSRSSLLLAPHPDDDDRRVLVRGKGNLSAPPRSFEFAIESRDLLINDLAFNLPVVAQETVGDLEIDDLLKPERAAPVRTTLADEIDAAGTGQVQTRAELARAVGREADDRSVGRALDQLEADDRWTKEGRGKWRRLGIGTYRDVPMSNLGDGGSR